jgi:Ca2+-binding RTX toxin-like protein
MTGGSGDDTLIASTSGPDTMTGGAGADHFQFNTVPWQADNVTDFTHGVDRIDVSHLLAGVGYSGTDPIADGYIKFGDDGQGNTWVYFDRDGHGTADQWGTKVVTLDHVSASTITGSDFIFQSGAASPPPPPASPPPPPSSGGQVLTGQDGGSNLVGGSGDDTLIGGHGQDTMTGAAGADHFTWNDVPWAFSQITDFTEGQDKIDVSHLLSAVGYSGTDPIADGYIRFGDDGNGNTWIYFDRDGSAGTADMWGTHLATLQHVSAATLSGSDFIFH